MESTMVAWPHANIVLCGYVHFCMHSRTVWDHWLLCNAMNDPATAVYAVLDCEPGLGCSGDHMHVHVLLVFTHGQFAGMLLSANPNPFDAGCCSAACMHLMLCGHLACACLLSGYCSLTHTY